MCTSVACRLTCKYRQKPYCQQRSSCRNIIAMTSYQCLYGSFLETIISSISYIAYSDILILSAEHLASRRARLQYSPVGESVKVEVEVTAMEVVRGTKLYHFNVSTIDFYSSVHLFSLARTRVHVAKAHLYNYCSPLNNPVKGE